MLLLSDASYGDDAADRLRNEMPRSLSGLDAKYSSQKSQVIIEGKMSDVVTKRVNREYRHTVTRNHKELVVSDIDLSRVTPYTSRRPYERVFGANAEYLFKAYRQHPDGVWVLTNFETTERPGLLREIAESHDRRQLASLSTLPITYNKLGLNKLFDQNGFRLGNTISGTWPGAVRAEFQYDHIDDSPNVAESSRGIVSGAVVFDSTNHWIPREWDTKLTLAAGVAAIEYKGTRTVTLSHNAYTLKAIQHNIQLQKGQPRSETETEIATIVTIDPPIDPAVFRLSAYGLPEPEGLIVRRPPYHLWAIGIGVGCLVMFFLIRWWLGRRRAGVPR